METEADIVVVGGGIAGVTCCETLAFLGPNLKIILITKSQLIKTVTNLVAITKTIVNFDVEEKNAETLHEKYSNVTIIFDTLLEIISHEKTIRTESNRCIKYKFVCLCMGGQPKLIDFNNKFVLGIRDTDSVSILQDRIKSSRKILIVGNGGIATELVYELKNIEIIWAVKDNFISSTFLDPGAAEFFQFKMKDADASGQAKTIVKRLRYSEIGNGSRSGGVALGPDWHTKFDISGTCSKSVSIIYNSEIEQVTHLENEEWPLSVRLTNGTCVECDLIVSATGVLPCSNIKTDQELKLAADGGIEVNGQMETSISGVYAAGDVCTANWEHAKHWFQMRLWSQARQMASYAAKSIISRIQDEQVLQDFCFELFSHSTTLFGFKVILLGLFNGQKLHNQYECLVRITPNMEYIKLVIQDGKIQGAILIGDTDLEETMENLILNQLDVSVYGEDLLNPDIDIEDYFD
ncbi:pyridine nucleotide-disulfide oxidoreductase domain-containing protein 1 [Chrysoperla carnea]|uniref:pyridine nucleotide-disulfide oxidoreductase domain-containing protein 1 n=1 Tax=Chrysoperla carnea TaxID=189513 RepID=UPI001D0702EF|nr:pyridine nucleotide-disulfide oxidoreductase domain-containing protein 1 [Chrysoperla carnea]